MQKFVIFYPILTQIFLVLFLYLLLGYRRYIAVNDKLSKLKGAELDNQVWPKYVIQVSNNIANQFETPVIFYVLCLIVYLTDTVDIISLSLAWTFVFLRYFHTYIHISSNNIPKRFISFTIATSVLAALFVTLIINISG